MLLDHYHHHDYNDYYYHYYNCFCYCFCFSWLRSILLVIVILSPPLTLTGPSLAHAVWALSSFPPTVLSSSFLLRPVFVARKVQQRQKYTTRINHWNRLFWHAENNPTTTTTTTATTTTRTTLTRLQMDTQEEAEESDNKNDMDTDTDPNFAAWVNEALRPWPFRPPTTTSSANNKNYNDDDDDESSFWWNENDLSNRNKNNYLINNNQLWNLQALLLLADPNTSSSSTRSKEDNESLSASSSNPFSVESLWNAAASGLSLNNYNNRSIWEELASLEQWLTLALKQNVATTLTTNPRDSLTTADPPSLPAQSLPSSVNQTTNATTFTTSMSSSSSWSMAESILKLATAQVELVTSLSQQWLSSPTRLASLIRYAHQTLSNTTVARDYIQTAQQMALQRGLNWTQAAQQAQQAVAYAAKLSNVADSVLNQGYVTRREEDNDDTDGWSPPPPSRRIIPQELEQETITGAAAPSSRALLADFASVSELTRLTPSLRQSAELAALAGAIYEQTLPRIQALGQAAVAFGATRNVKWMVTDAVVLRSSSLSTRSSNESPLPTKTSSFNTVSKNGKEQNTVKSSSSPTPLLVRTITIRGFDASDDEVDREELLNSICYTVSQTMTPPTTPLTQPAGNVLAVHSGLLEIARGVYQDILQYVDWLPPGQKLILNGHSIGGSIATLVLFLLTQERGAEFVKDKIWRVYTFGSPPVVRLQPNAPEVLTQPERINASVSSSTTTKPTKVSSSPSTSYCDILDVFNLPTDIVYSYVQPWDPIVRIFSKIDALYPLVSDLGADGVTPFANGPPRTLRPITKAIIEAWKGWPRFRDTMLEGGTPNYRSVGVQHILVPEPTRYLADRFVAVNIPVPPVEAILRISSNELLDALSVAFPLDEFQISFVPEAIRSFVHHFYPAYGYPMVDYVKRLEKQQKQLSQREGSEVKEGFPPSDASLPKGVDAAVADPILSWGLASQWLSGNSE